MKQKQHIPLQSTLVFLVTLTLEAQLKAAVAAAAVAVAAVVGGADSYADTACQPRISRVLLAARVNF